MTLPSETVIMIAIAVAIVILITVIEDAARMRRHRTALAAIHARGRRRLAHCRSCGATDEDLDDSATSWAEPNLCSSCADDQDAR